MKKYLLYKTVCKDDRGYMMMLHRTNKTAKIKKLGYLAAHSHRVNVLTSNITFYNNNNNNNNNAVFLLVLFAISLIFDPHALGNIVCYSSILVFFCTFLCGNCKRSFCLFVILFSYFLHYLFIYYANK